MEDSSIRLPTLTLGWLLVFTLVYVGQLLLAGDFSASAALESGRELAHTVGAGSVVFSWLFHSSHSHFVGNVVVFVLAGWWVEGRTPTDHFLIGVGLLGITPNVVALVVFNIPGFGISGITTGMVAMIAVGSYDALSDPSEKDWKAVALFTVGTVYTLLSLGVIGALPTGTAGEIHLLGAILGVAWYFIETRHYSFTHSPEPKTD